MLAHCPARSNQRLLLRPCHMARLPLCCAGTPANKRRDRYHKAFGVQTLMPAPYGQGCSSKQTGTARSTRTRHRNGALARRGAGLWEQAGFVSVPHGPFQPQERKGLPQRPLTPQPPLVPQGQRLWLEKEAGCCSRCRGTSSGLGRWKEVSNQF